MSHQEPTGNIRTEHPKNPSLLPAPLSQALTTPGLSNIRLVATDIDRTLTQQGKFTPAMLLALDNLAQAGIQVLMITGRSAGWVSCIANYLPVLGAIGENGGIFYASDGKEPGILLTPIHDREEHRQKLDKMFQQLQTQFPEIQESSDNCFRITEWAFDNPGLSYTEIQQMVALCQEQGWDLTYDNLRCHIMPPKQSKGNGLLTVLRVIPGLQYYHPIEVVTVGDSLNDESLFDPKVFPLSVGVANVLSCSKQLQNQPTYITDAAEGQGFCELATALAKLGIQRQLNSPFL